MTANPFAAYEAAAAADRAHRAKLAEMATYLRAHADTLTSERSRLDAENHRAVAADLDRLAAHLDY